VEYADSFLEKASSHMAIINVGWRLRHGAHATHRHQWS
jgi:hypothetical protein